MGINLYGFFKSSIGLGQGIRLYRQALALAGMPTAAIDTTALLPGSPADAPPFPAQTLYGLNLVHLNPDVLPLLYQLTAPELWNRRYQIGVWLWELPRLPWEWRRMLPAFDEFWAPSRFIAEAIARDTGVPVTWIPYGIEAPLPADPSRAAYGLPEDAFLVLCMFDVSSFLSRKNPAASVEAFRLAFPEEPGVRLVLKTHSAGPEELSQIRTLVGEDPRILMVHENMEKTSVNGLISCCDAVISLHRSEGFGLILAEAMLLGVPVVATGWSANTDFMDEGCACMVQYTLIPTRGDYMGAQRDQLWADPDARQAAEFLRRLYQDPAYRARIGAAGRERITTEFSLAACAARMKARLAELQCSQE